MGSRMSVDTNKENEQGVPRGIQNPVLDKISTIYKCELVEGKSNKPGRNKKFLATSEFYPKFKENLDSDVKFTVTGKVDGSCCYVYKGRLMKRRDVKPGKKEPEDWLRTSENETNEKHKKHSVGFVDVSMTNKEDKWLRKVILRMGGTQLNTEGEVVNNPNEDEKVYLKTLSIVDGETLIRNVPIEELEGQTVEFVGPNVQKNDHKFKEFCVVPHGMFHLQGFPKKMEFNAFVEWFKEDRLAKCFEGVVVHFENGQLFKIHRHHLDMKWETSEGLHYLNVE